MEMKIRQFVKFYRNHLTWTITKSSYFFFNTIKRHKIITILITSNTVQHLILMAIFFFAIFFFIGVCHHINFFKKKNIRRKKILSIHTRWLRVIHWVFFYHSSCMLEHSKELLSNQFYFSCYYFIFFPLLLSLFDKCAWYESFNLSQFFFMIFFFVKKNYMTNHRYDNLDDECCSSSFPYVSNFYLVNYTLLSFEFWRKIDERIYKKRVITRAFFATYKEKSTKSCVYINFNKRTVLFIIFFYNSNKKRHQSKKWCGNWKNK